MLVFPRDVPKLLAWIGVAAHLCVGVIALRRPSGLSVHRLLPMLNLAVAVCVLAYWARAWYGYLTRDVTWYASDQLLPLCAAIVAILCALTLSGRFDDRVANGIQWLVFALDALVLTAAALYLTFMRFDRLV